MLAEQGGICAICLRTCRTYPNLTVDHDHETGEVRGLLCRGCNVLLGHLQDDTGSLKRAISYLNS